MSEHQAYWRYAGINRLMERAYAAGRASEREARWWVEQHYGEDRNQPYAPPIRAGKPPQRSGEVADGLSCPKG